MTFSRPASSPGQRPFAPAERPPVDDYANATEALREKLTDAQTPGYQAEFDPDEAERKAELEKTLLSKEQQAALTRIKRYTDFNDLATQSRLGWEGVKRQVKITVNKAIEEAQQKQEQRRQQTQRQRRTRRAVNM